MVVDGSVFQTKNLTTAAIATRRETDFDVPHTHIENSEPAPVSCQIVAVLGGGASAPVPFIHSPAMDTNQVAIRASYDLNMAASRIAMMASLPSFICVG